MSDDTAQQQPQGWFGGASRVLFVHAHPDDETIATGGTLAGLAEAGAEPLLVTLTRGERGEVVAGPFSSLAGTPALASHRETELAAALFMLGVDRHAFLGDPPARAAGLPPRRYADSGMVWGAAGLALPSPEATPEALTAAPAVELLNDLLALADEWQVSAIVSYDAIGGYGHPDHILAHRLARAVARGLDVPFWEIVTEQANAAGVDPLTDAPVAAHDVEPWLERKVAALRSHATQLTVSGDELVHVGGQRQPIERTERFRQLPHPE